MNTKSFKIFLVPVFSLLVLGVIHKGGTAEESIPKEAIAAWMKTKKESLARRDSGVEFLYESRLTSGRLLDIQKIKLLGDRWLVQDYGKDNTLNTADDLLAVRTESGKFLATGGDSTTRHWSLRGTTGLNEVIYPHSEFLVQRFSVFPMTTVVEMDPTNWPLETSNTSCTDSELGGRTYKKVTIELADGFVMMETPRQVLKQVVAICDPTNDWRIIAAELVIEAMGKHIVKKSSIEYLPGPVVKETYKIVADGVEGEEAITENRVTKERPKPEEFTMEHYGFSMSRKTSLWQNANFWLLCAGVFTVVLSFSIKVLNNRTSKPRET